MTPDLHTPSELPGRIISLVPSLSELLFDLGLNDRVVGITRYCVHPTQWQKEKTIVGGTKKFDFEAIAGLKPDLIVANKEENYKEGIEVLQQDFNVLLTDIYDLNDGLSVITRLGQLTGTSQNAERIVNEIQAAFSSLSIWNGQQVLYLIWRKPWMAAARNTFIDSMISQMGLKNALSDVDRYPELSSDQIRALSPEYIFLSSEPYPFSEKHVQEIQSLSPHSKIVLVDGEMFSWYGSRLRLSPGYFNELKLDVERRR